MRLRELLKTFTEISSLSIMVISPTRRSTRLASAFSQLFRLMPTPTYSRRSRVQWLTEVISNVSHSYCNREVFTISCCLLATIQYAPTASAEDAPAVTIIPIVNAANTETSVSPVPSSSSSPPSATTSAPAASTQSTSSASRPVHDIWLALPYPFIVFLVYLL
jgi:hypothetical protein